MSYLLLLYIVNKRKIKANLDLLLVSVKFSNPITLLPNHYWRIVAVKDRENPLAYLFCDCYLEHNRGF